MLTAVVIKQDSLSFSDDDLDPDEDRPSNDEKVPAEKVC